MHSWLTFSVTLLKWKLNYWLVVGPLSFYYQRFNKDTTWDCGVGDGGGIKANDLTLHIRLYGQYPVSELRVLSPYRQSLQHPTRFTINFLEVNTNVVKPGLAFCQFYGPNWAMSGEMLVFFHTNTIWIGLPLNTPGTISSIIVQSETGFHYLHECFSPWIKEVKKDQTCYEKNDIATDTERETHMHGQKCGIW